MPSQAVVSSQNGFSLRTMPRFQLNEGANPGATAINAALLIMLPDPDSGVAGATSEFITAVPAGQPWNVQIVEIENGAVTGTIAYSATVPIANNAIWVALDPAVFVTTKSYRVRLFDPGNNLAEEWDFKVHDHNVTAVGPGDLASINNAIRRIAGLLGYRQRVSYSDFNLGIPQTTLIELLDATQATLASYRVKTTLDSALNITSQTAAALDANVL